jgi:hypothetical protein
MEVQDAHVRQGLGLVDGIQALDALHLDHHLVVDDKVRAVLPNQVAFVENGNANLSLVREPGRFQLDAESFFIRGLQQPWTKLSVHVDGVADNRMRQRIVFVHCVPQCLGASVFRISEGR